MRQIILLSLWLAFIWLANSGHYTSLILVLGAISIAFTVWLSAKMAILNVEIYQAKQGLHILLYWPWLIKEIVVSNINVVKKIWLSPSSIEPSMAILPVTQKTDVGRVIYANSITLTPGTVCLELSDDEVIVHALTREGIEDLKEGEMSRRVSEIEN